MPNTDIQYTDLVRPPPPPLQLHPKVSHPWALDTYSTIHVCTTTYIYIGIKNVHVHDLSALVSDERKIKKTVSVTVKQSLSQ